MRTRDKILQEGLKQLNELGVEQVSIRSIASALDISPGNLTYHFKNTDTIIYELYLLLVDQLSVSIEILQEIKINVPQFFELTYLNYQLMWSYRFILLDFVAITRRIDPIRAHFRGLMGERQQQFRVLCHLMIREGLFRPEWIDGLYDRFILQSIIISDAWVADAAVNFPGKPEQALRFYADLFAGSILPYLTEKGIEQYRQWRADHPAPSLDIYNDT